ncbi:MAG: hypothetical protein AB7T49_02835 [Oligoflexales bacterium]
MSRFATESAQAYCDSDIKHEIFHYIPLIVAIIRPRFEVQRSLTNHLRKGNLCAKYFYLPNISSADANISKILLLTIEDEYPRLSDVDIKALKVFYFSPMVKIGLHANGFFHFYGNKATHYRYKMGPTDEINCSDENGYSEPKLLDESNGSQHGISVPEGTGRFKICAIGGKDDDWQPLEMASRRIVDL